MRWRDVCAPALAGLILAGAARAQYQYPVFNPSPSQVSNEWRNQLFTSAPQGSYSRWLVVTDWFSSGTGTQSSRQATVGLSAIGGVGTFSAPQYPGSSPGESQYALGAFGFNSTTTTESRTVFWFGNLSVPRIIATGELAPFRGGDMPLHFNFRQTSAGTNANWSNVRVVLDPNIVDDRTYVRLSKPAAFTDFGTLTVGNTSITQPVSSTSQNTNNWFRFRLDRDVPFQGSDVFDLFRSGTTNNVPYFLFKNTPGGLVLFDLQNSFGGVLSYGSDQTDIDGRPYGSDSLFLGRGGALNSIDPVGLLASEEYFLLVGGIGSSVSDVTTGANSILDPDGISVHQLGTVTTTLRSGTAAGDSFLNIRSIPAPSVLVSLALAVVPALRRRRCTRGFAAR